MNNVEEAVHKALVDLSPDSPDFFWSIRKAQQHLEENGLTFQEDELYRILRSLESEGLVDLGPHKITSYPDQHGSVTIQHVYLSRDERLSISRPAIGRKRRRRDSS